MKPATTLSLVVIAVLATVVIEESRLKHYRSELADLQALRATQPAPERVEEEPEAVVESSAASVGHELPANFPVPNSEEIKTLAASPRAGLYLELGLTVTEQAYVENLITGLRKQQQELAAAWIAAAPDQRADLEAKLREAEVTTDEALRGFFREEKEFKVVQDALALQPDVELYRQLEPYLSVQGVGFNKTKEDRFIEALHQIRMTVGGIDWNSPDALPFHATGTAADRFRQEWKRINEGLEKVLPVFLDRRELEAVEAARKELYESLKETISPADEAGPEEEAPAAEEPADQ
ncbi:hypothetical protein [Haloferula sargassicola]|uniref:PpiC domain-containing protein n=1 Tax=Haloferula sargassicola TaxID=490096 RepID=A0ABP9URN7_9BACT